MSALYKIVAAVLLAYGLAVSGVALWRAWQLDTAQASIASLTKDLAAAQADVARWEAAAKAKDVAAAAQAQLAASCLQRAAQAQTDAAAIADIMGQAKSSDIAPEQARQGVDDATRQRAADMLNRPW